MHDSKGTPIAVGDKLIIRGKLKAITSEQPTFCNIVFEADEVMASGGDPYTLSLSARMTEKVE